MVPGLADRQHKRTVCVNWSKTLFYSSIFRSEASRMDSRRKPSTKPIEKIGKVKDKLSNAEDVAFLPDDSVAVADKVKRKVQVFSKRGKFVKTLAEGVKPLGIAANRSGLVVFPDTNNGKSEIHVMTEAGEVVSRWGDEIVWKPRAVDITHKGQLVVTDAHAHTRHPVGVYTMEGQAVLRFGHQQLQQGDGEAFKPWHIAVDAFDRVLVTDRESNTIKIFATNTGNLLTIIGERKVQASSGLRRKFEPRGLTTDAQGNIMVCDVGSDSVVVYSPDGRVISSLLDRSDGIVSPYSIAFSHVTGVMAVGCNSAGGALRKLRLYQVQQASVHTGSTRDATDDE